MARKSQQQKELERLAAEVRVLAIEYYRLTGKPLGITGEIGEVETAKLLDLKLAPARQAGYDATDRSGRKLQIKARCIPDGPPRSQQVGSIKFKHRWNAVLLILMDMRFEPIEIWKASRGKLKTALEAPGSKARNERGSLAVSKFKKIGRCVWPVGQSNQ